MANQKVNKYNEKNIKNIKKSKRNSEKTSKKKSKRKSKRSFFKLFSRNKKSSKKNKKNKNKSIKKRSSKKIRSKDLSLQEKPFLNNIVFTVSSRKLNKKNKNNNKNNVIHQRLIPNSPLLELESLLLGSPKSINDNKSKKSKKSKKSFKSEKQYPNYLDDLLEKSKRESQIIYPMPHSSILSPNLIIHSSNNPSYSSYQKPISNQSMIEQPIIEQPHNFKRVETSTFTSTNVNGDISKSGVKVISDSRNPKSHLFTLQDGHMTHEMVNHTKIKERVKRATKKMALLKKQKSIKSKGKKSKKKHLMIQKCSNIDM